MMGPLAEYHPTRALLAIADAGGRNITQVVDANSGKVLTTMEADADRVASAKFSFDGAFLVTTGADQKVRLWDSTSGVLLATWLMPERVIGAGQMDPTGTRIIVGSVDGPFRIWRISKDPPTPEEVEHLVRCRIPYRLKGGTLEPSIPDTQACRVP
jgi:WD40 repeat protein